ncbi:MAG: glycosyltransferase family 4 protein [Bacteroidia bacterium]|nr:glycosyltransferase family 4 protein [Bacteroidia bacterium]MDW8089273.1 glycosyltransferase family 4 protein [Bacteroidia bacterium]
MPLRILHLARTINRYDFIDTIVRYLPSDRFALEVATFDARASLEEPYYEAIGIPHHVVRVPHWRAYPAYFWAAYKLWRLIRRRGIHILHTHHYWEGFVGSLVKRLAPRLKFILHRHYTEDVVRVPGLKGRLLRKLEAFAYASVDVLLVPTPTMAEFIQQNYPKSNLPLMVIPYGFDLGQLKYQPLSAAERLAVRAQYRVGEEAVVIGNFATHRWQKGQHLLLEAVAELVQRGYPIRLWLVGGGPATPALQAQARQLGIMEFCTFWGWQRGPIVRTLMGSCDIIAHPTYSEAFPQVMVEALALERALVIAAVSGAREWLKPGVHAWVIPPGDRAALLEALLTLVRQPELRRQLGTAGRAQVLAHLSYTAINPAYEALYQRLCSL